LGGLSKFSLRELCNKYTDGFTAQHYSRAQASCLFGKYFSDVSIEIYGQKNELWQIRRGRLKDFLVRCTPTILAEGLLRRFGWFLFVEAVKK